MKKPRRTWRWLPFAASAALTVGIFAYLLSQIDPALIARSARGVAFRPLAMFLALSIVGVVARASRYWLLLGKVVSMKLLIAVTLARNLFIDLVPARLGELSYVYLLSRRAGRPVEEGLSSLLLSVLFDVVALGPLLGLALVVVGGRQGLPIYWLLSLGLALAGIAYACIRLAEPVGRRVARWLDSSDPTTRRSRLALRVRATTAALAAARRRGVFVPVLAVSGVVRLCKFGSYYALFLAVMAPFGYAADTLGFFRVFLGVLGAELSAALPIHGIAGFGTFEGAWAFSFAQLGYSKEHAIVSGIVAHGVSQLVEYTIGGLALLWLMQPIRSGQGGSGNSAGAGEYARL